MAKRKPITVFDTTTPRWATIVEALVGQYNANRPDICPPLLYRRLEVGYTTRQPGINVSNVSLIGETRGCPGCGYTTWGKGGLAGGADITTVAIEDTDETYQDGGLGTAVVCHELVHAIAHAVDGPRDQDSCMRGPRNDFGSWDWSVITKRCKRMKEKAK